MAGVIRLTTAAALLVLTHTAGYAAPLRKFGSIGIDGVSPSGRYYQGYANSQVPLEPCFRTGIFVWRDLAVGADLSLVGTFPRHSSPFFSTPQVCFGPNVSYFAGLPNPAVRPYASAGWGLHYISPRSHGWRSVLALGCGYVFPGLRLGPVLELGWYHSRVRLPAAQTSLNGDVPFLGVRLMAFR